MFVGDVPADTEMLSAVVVAEFLGSVDPQVLEAEALELMAGFGALTTGEAFLQVLVRANDA